MIRVCMGFTMVSLPTCRNLIGLKVLKNLHIESIFGRLFFSLRTKSHNSSIVRSSHLKIKIVSKHILISTIVQESKFQKL